MNEKEAIKLLDNLDGMIEDNHGSDYDAAFKMAIKALEKQIPKKPNEDQKDSVGDVIPRCPSCFSMYIEKYCAKCGQKIDWTVEE